MSKLIRIYIGSDNTTHIISEAYRDKVIMTMNRLFEGYTIYQGVGFYNKIYEDTMIIESIANDDTVSNLKIPLEQLKQELGQESILVTQQEINHAFI